MKVSIKIEREGQSPLEISTDITSVGKMQKVSDIESFLLSLSSETLPLLGEKLLEASQDDYVSKKKANATGSVG
jgi:hypothetical protein